jgi:phosphoesterase RecJ-like protein
VLDVAEVLRGAQRISTFCHENPDADTLGAAIAIAMAAERLGKQAEVVSGDPPPPFLSFLPGVERVRRSPALEPDVAVVVDAGELTRIGSVLTEQADWFARARVVNIDHHVSNPGYGEAVWIDPEAAATCELVTLLLPELGVALDAELATALMAGIVQDTHTFAHPNTTARTLHVAAQLVEAGAPLAAINRSVYADRPYSTLALWGLMLAGIGQRAGGRIVFASMTAAMLTTTGEKPTASEGFVDLLASTKLADVTILFKEVGPEETRVSVRTTARADAVAITSAF